MPRCFGLLTALLDRPQPVRLVLAGIISGRRRDQLRALLPEMIEATAHRLALHRVDVERVVWYRGREILKHGPKPDGGSEVAPGSGFRRPAKQANDVADDQPRFACVLAVALLGLNHGGGDEREDMRRGQRVEVFMANDFEAVAPESNPETGKKMRCGSPSMTTGHFSPSAASGPSSKATGVLLSRNRSPDRTPVYGFLPTAPNAVVEPIHPRGVGWR